MSFKPNQPRYSHVVRLLLALVAVLLFAVGCASAQATPAPSAPTVVSAPIAAPTSVPAAASAATASAATASAATASATSTPAAVPATGAGATGSFIRLVAVPDKSQAQYRVREQLAGVNLPSDAIGRTRKISGEIVGKPDGTIDSTQSKFVVDLSSLTSDRSQRDNFLRRAVLQTDQYPSATFVPTQAPGMPKSVPANGDAAFKLVGNLTIRDVTKEVTWDVTCKAQSDQGTCQASTTFQFEYFGLTPPRVPVVLSVEDNIRLEVEIDLQRAGV